jgi:hypothetical protein
MPCVGPTQPRHKSRYTGRYVRTVRYRYLPTRIAANTKSNLFLTSPPPPYEDCWYVHREGANHKGAEILLSRLHFRLQDQNKNKYFKTLSTHCKGERKKISAEFKYIWLTVNTVQSSWGNNIRDLMLEHSHPNKKKMEKRHTKILPNSCANTPPPPQKKSS